MNGYQEMEQVALRQMIVDALYRQGVAVDIADQVADWAMRNEDTDTISWTVNDLVVTAWVNDTPPEGVPVFGVVDIKALRWQARQVVGPVI